MQEIRNQVAKLLLEIKAVHVYNTEPFTLTSGIKSPVYVDCRKLISFPVQRRKVIEAAGKLLEGKLGGIPFDLIAGGETAGIPYAAWLSDYLNLPMIYVRKQPKGFGRMAQIEGALDEGKTVLLVEDLIFDAQSKINFCMALRKAGAKVEHGLVIFDYGIPESRKNLEAENIQIYALTDWPTLLAVGQDLEYFSGEQALEIRKFLDNPPGWKPAGKTG